MAAGKIKLITFPKFKISGSMHNSFFFWTLPYARLVSITGKEPAL